MTPLHPLNCSLGMLLKKEFAHRKVFIFFIRIIFFNKLQPIANHIFIVK